MWSAFMNGSGLHGGGGAGGGYVPSQGWEFVPCSRMERADRGRGKSPLRRISSPPTVFSQLYEPQFGSPPAGGESGAGTQLEILRGQMWPGPEPQQQQQQQQTQHTRLKKKFEDLKKRHVQDKEEWMREKESLLREVADIQGGENRRILLDLKTVLEEVQAEVKREEERRSELQLQYTRDRCAWDLEKAELKCRIAQLEAREATGSVSGGVQAAAAAAGPGSVASRSPREQHGETSTLRREREEQRRLLADTHSTAMDLRCRLEHSERDWLKEKAELLERFDVERREWESQLKDMQKKIEELYCEVRVKRGGTGLDRGRQDDDDVARRLSIRSNSTGSSLLSDNSRSEPLSSSSQSEPHRHHPPVPSFGPSRSISADGSCGNRDSRHSACFQPDSLCEFNVGGQFTQNDRSQPELMEEFRSRGRDTNGKEAVDTSELEAVFHGTPGCGGPQEHASKGNERSVSDSPRESPLWAGLSYGSDKKKNTTALNAALKEIARVSEELCSYQDEIRKKSGDKRNRSEESETLFEPDKPPLEVDEAPCDLSQIYDDFRAMGRENWITLSPDNTWQANRGLGESWTTNTSDPDSHRGTQTSPGVHSEMDTPAPPIPPRTSSWNLSAHPDTELHIPESPVTTARRCHSPCVLVDKKCSSPSIVRKFGAMLQENEGKVFVDGMVASCSVPVNSNCNTGCCHNRWSCDPSKFTNSKLSAYGIVQKSFSEVNILSAGKDLRSDYNVGNLKSLELQMPPVVREIPVDLLLSSLEIPPVSSYLQGSKRNIMLEQKTAEFNRTLFQAEMGRGVEERDSFAVTDTSFVGCQPVLTTSDEVFPTKENKFQPHCADVTSSITGSHPEVTLSISESTLPRQMRCTTESQEVRIKQEVPSVPLPDQSQSGLREATVTSQSPVHHCDVKYKVPTGNSPSRKTQHKAATETLFPEPVLPANTRPGQPGDDSSSMKENPHGAKPQPARAGVSLTQSSAENKQRQMTQPRHVSDSSRPSPRMMNDHPWKPLTLAAYPRPEGSRSNYGAVERILKNYESAARAQQNQSQPDETPSSPNFAVRQEELVKELDVLSVDSLRQTSQTLTTHAQLSSHSTTAGKAIELLVQDHEEPSVSSSSVQKNFSRPARPANRRLPSRWASRSPTSSSSPSSSPSTTPVAPPSFPLQKHSSSFTYSHAFHIETVII